jgi:hypothetical protein
VKPNSKEVFSKAAAHIFHSLGSMCDAANAFYEAGYPEDGDKMIEAVSQMISDLPAFPG